MRPSTSDSIGLSRLAQREHPTGAGYVGNGTVLNYDTPDSGDSANDLAGLDSLGRVVKQKTHTVGDTTAAQADIEYRPNFNGSPKFADNLSKPVAARSNLYTYDGLHRTTQVDTGVLNSGRTDVLDEWSDPSQTVHTMDIQGKPTTTNRKNSDPERQRARLLRIRPRAPASGGTRRRRQLHQHQPRPHPPTSFRSASTDQPLHPASAGWSPIPTTHSHRSSISAGLSRTSRTLQR